MLKSANTAYSSCHPQTLISGVTGFLRPSKHTHLHENTHAYMSMYALPYFCRGGSDILGGDGGNKAIFLFLFVSVHDGGKDSHDI